MLHTCPESEAVLGSAVGDLLPFSSSFGLFPKGRIRHTHICSFPVIFSLTLGSLLKHIRHCWKSHLKESDGEEDLRCCCLLLCWHQEKSLIWGLKVAGQGQRKSRGWEIGTSGARGHRLSLTFSEELPFLSLFSHYFPHPTASSCTSPLSDSQISQAFSDPGPQYILLPKSEMLFLWPNSHLSDFSPNLTLWWKMCLISPYACLLAPCISPEGHILNL